PTKGAIRVGSDADLTIVDLNKPWEINSEKLHSKNRVTPFDGWKGKGMPIATIVRGQVVMQKGELLGQPQGRIVCPSDRRETSAVAA
ncbi:MAG: amidohydrolase family protein, partial [Dehalococcoidia bacterium]